MRGVEGAIFDALHYIRTVYTFPILTITASSYCIVNVSRS